MEYTAVLWIPMLEITFLSTGQNPDETHSLA